MRNVVLSAAVVSALAGAAAAQSPLTTGDPNNGRSTGMPGAFFDLRVGSDPLRVTSWDYFASSAAGTPTTVSIYYKLGSFVGFDEDPAAWTLLDTVPGVSAGTATPLSIDPADLMLDADTSYGIYFRTDAGGLRYRGSTGVPPFIYSTAELEFEGGRVRADPWGGTLFDPRLWSGSIHYDVIPAPASLALFGFGALVATRRRR